MIHVGTSGWQYRDWRGDFYPHGLGQSEWLAWYATSFTTVEVNNSFYRLPERATFERWRSLTPASFRFAVKASRFITHLKRFRDPAEPLALLWDRARGLAGKMGPILLQTPPDFPADLERLRDVLAAVPRGMRPAFEFRHRSWNDPAVHRLLDRAGAAWVLADRPGARIVPVVTGGWAYVRFHQGTPAVPGYRAAKLARWADRIAVLGAEDTWIYFNNDTGGAAIRDARRMIHLLGERDVPVAAPDPGHESREAREPRRGRAS